MATPVRTRPISSPGRVGHHAMTAAAAMPNASAGTMMRRRPSLSERLPKRYRLAPAPTTMQAKASVTMGELSPSRTAYSGHSGVGTVPNACNDTKAAVTSQKPMLCGTTRLRALIVDNLRGAAAIVECSAIGGSPVLTVFLTGSSASTPPVRTPMPVRRQRAQMPFICLADGVVQICCNSGVERRWPMELRQLRHFLALAEERSITRAARRELIVQSGLSNSIQALERELGTPLSVRATRPRR